MSSRGSSINIDLTFNQPQPTPPSPTDTSQASRTSSIQNSQEASPIHQSPNPSSPQLSPQIQADIDQITVLLQQASSPSHDHHFSHIPQNLPTATTMEHDPHQAGYQAPHNPAAPTAADFDDPHSILAIIQQQQAQMALLIQQLQNKSNVDTKPKVKVPLPDTFDGKRTKCESFLHQLHLVFRGDPAN
jgi:hypothetical protein